MSESASTNRPTAAMDDWVSQVLGVKLGPRLTPETLFTPESATGSPNDGAFVAMQKARLAWDSLRQSIQGQLRALESEIVRVVEVHNAEPEQPEKFDPKAVAEGTKKLYGILGGLDTRLIDALDLALKASGDERKALQAKAKDVISEYQGFVANDKMIGAIDSNGFTKTAIKSTVEKTLVVLSSRL